MHSGNFFKKILNIEGAMTIQILKCFFLKKGGRHQPFYAYCTFKCTKYKRLVGVEQVAPRP